MTAGRVPVIDIRQGETPILRIGADEIWINPTCNVDAVARHFIAAIHNQIHAIVEYEVSKRLRQQPDETNGT